MIRAVRAVVHENETPERLMARDDGRQSTPWRSGEAAPRARPRRLLAPVAPAGVQRAPHRQPLVGPPAHAAATHQRVVEGVVTAGLRARDVRGLPAGRDVRRRTVHAGSALRCGSLCTLGSSQRHRRRNCGRLVPLLVEDTKIADETGSGRTRIGCVRWARTLRARCARRRAPSPQRRGCTTGKNGK